MASAKSNTKSSAISRHFVICLSPGKTPASLEAGKVYERVRDATAESTGMLRIIDESGAVLKAEIHWYEAHGIGKVEHKIKRYL